MSGQVFRRKLALFAALWLMLWSMAACDRGAQAPAAGNESPAASPAAASADPARPEEENVREITSEYYTPFAPPITVNTLSLQGAVSQYPPGDTWEDNLWTRAYRDKLGVTFQSAWQGSAEELPAALEVMAAANALPDYMVLPYDSFHSLASQGMLAPLNSAVEAYAHPSVREALSLYDGAAIRCATFREELLGLMNAPPREGVMLWYRQDWFAAAGLESPPATFEDVLAMAQAFAADPMKTGTATQGFALNPQLFCGAVGYPTGLEGFFSAYGAYPTQWQEDGGELVHGSTHNAMRQALAALSGLVRQGALSGEMKGEDPWMYTLETIAENRAGMAFAPYWFTGWLENTGALAAQGEAVPWVCMPIPGLSGAPNAVPTLARTGEVTCIRLGYAYPELAVKMVNLTRGLIDGDIAEPQYVSVDGGEGRAVPTASLAMASGGGLSDNGRGDIAGAVTGALAIGSKEGLSGEALFLLERCQAWLEQGDASAYALYIQYGPGGSQGVLADMRARGLMLPDAYYGPDTPAMGQSYRELMQARDEMIRAVLQGEDADAAFDGYLNAFQGRGGREITREVNDWFASR